VFLKKGAKRLQQKMRRPTLTSVVTFGGGKYYSKKGCRGWRRVFIQLGEWIFFGGWLGECAWSNSFIGTHHSRSPAPARAIAIRRLLRRPHIG